MRRSGCPGLRTPNSCGLLRSRHLARFDLRHHGLRESLHLLELGAHLEQHQLHARSLELRDALGDLTWRTDQTRAEPAVRDRVVLEAEALLELRSAHPLIEVLESRCTGTERDDALDLAPRLLLGVATHHVRGHAESQRGL